MKFILFLFTLFLISGCNAESSKIAYDQKKQCKNDLMLIASKNFDFNGINKDDIIFDFSEKDFIKIFVKSKSRVNNGATFGWIRIDRKDNKLYDITYDEENNIPMNLFDRKDYIRKCL
ncbi:hypothetical protein ACIF8R_06885 [Acinetobacter sp. ABJ_C4_1]|uniref:hypothetical protein n=1 Tax=Acinetobacter sp. ABJ_C4_1 TaxID=3377080 RepID=UPI0037CA191A